MVRHTSIRSNQLGMASILITLIMVIVITLIVSGFVQVSLRENSQSVDRQLSTQAYYAAETGVNDAINAVNNGYLNAANNPDGKTNCAPDSGTVGGSTGYDYPNDPLGGIGSNNVNGTAGSSNVQYTCLLINPTLTNLQATVGLDNSWVVPIQGILGGVSKAPTTLTFSWDESGGGSTFSGCPTSTQNTFTKYNAWNNCDAGVIQLDILDGAVFNGGSACQGSANQAAAVTNCWSPPHTMTVYLEPFKPGAATGLATYSGVGAVTEGSIIPANCTGGANPSCQVTISNIPNTATAATSLYLNLRSFYVANLMNITGTVGAPITPTPVSFAQAQVLIDSTGKANDVLRRIVVHAQASFNNPNKPVYAIQSTDDLCKLFTLQAPGSALALSAGLPAGCMFNGD